MLYSFGATSADGTSPNGLIRGTDGNLYGTTDAGGANTCIGTKNNCGTVFKITPGGVETVLYSFGATSADGMYPNDLILGADGNFYGTTASGGANTCLGISNNCGIVFKITPGGVETVLYSFGAPNDDGTNPNGLILGTDGNFYGTTAYGGTNLCEFYAIGLVGCGTVFRITPAGVETVLYSFGATGADGAIPFAQLTLGTDGNFYGTTYSGGANACAEIPSNCGTVFKVTPAGVETVLHSFGATSTDGVYPNGLVVGTDGNLYGTTISGGANSFFFAGTFFEITPAGVETVLYSFGATSADGMHPNDLILGADGNFYGTTHIGGANTCLGTANSCGTVFEITPEGAETVLYSFGATSTDGMYPDGLIPGTDGTLYGITTYGGVNLCARVSVNCGTVFQITP